MKKRTCAILLCLATVFILPGIVSAEETDESYMWSEPGVRYVVYALAPQKEIHDEAEAYAYALELWPLISAEPLPDGTRELDIDHHDTSYHFAIKDQDDMSLYNVGFLSNGVIQHISLRDSDPDRYSGERKDGTGLDSETWEKAKGWISDWVEKASPGILELVEPLSVYSILDNGDKQRLFISAMPLDPEDGGNINIIAILYADGRCEIIDYSCYGAG